MRAYLRIADYANHRSHGLGSLDIDDDNIRSSKKTVAANELESRIQVKKMSSSDRLIPLDDATGIQRYE